MADLLAKFRMIDEMSDKLGNIAESGQTALDKWEAAGNAANTAFENITSTSGAVAIAVDDVSSAIGGLQESAENAVSSAGDLAEAMSGYGDAAANAASESDYWTNAVGNYDKSVMEAVYSTEELVEMGLKSADALREQEQMLDLCDKSAGYLTKSLEATVSISDELTKTIDAADKAMASLSDSEKISAETKDALIKASETATEAMEELTRAQNDAKAAMEEYDTVMATGTTDLTQLEAAAERAGHAAEALAEANGKASEATDELSKATENASEEADKGGKNGISAIEGIASALAAAGITVKLKEITEGAYALATAFSDAESTVVLATGATGEALEGLTNSMMNAYAVSKTGSLSDTASTVGEINTRLGYTEEQLSETTEQFLDFAAVTGGNAASSVRSVTQLMNQWNVPAENMESMLSKLTYAGQASGIGVDSLSQKLITNKAVLDQLGFSLDESTAMFMKFELAGTNASTVMTGFRTALAKGDVSSLEELYEVFDKIASGAMTAADASELFGTRAGPAIVDAVQNGVLSLDDFVTALENSSGTLATTANAAQTLDQKWTQANNNIGAAFTRAVQPAFEKLSGGFADIVNNVGTFLNKHPTLTKAITAIGVGLGVVVAGIAGFTFVTQVAIPAVTSFGVALNTALGPIGWVALAIAGVVAVGGALVAMFSDAEDETEGMTAVTRAQYYELENLNAEYEEACKTYGETSEEALRLKYQVDDLSEAFENNRQTVEEFQAEVDELCTGVYDLWNEFDNAIAEINNSETSTLALIQKYDDLSQKAELTAGEQKQLEAVTESLAKKFPELTAQVDNAAISTDAYVAALRKAAEQEAVDLRQQEADDTYVKALAEREKLALELTKAEENLRLESEQFNSIDWPWWSDQAIYKNTGWDPFNVTNIDEYEAALEEVKAAIAENDAQIADLERDYEILAQKEREAAEQEISGAEAISRAYDGLKSDIEELCAAYDEAYQSALESFEGQYGLFDEASTKSEDYLTATVENAQKAIESQLAFWDTYLENVETLRATSAADLGITQENYEALMTYAQDGSEQAAGLAASMAEAINSGDKDAIAKLANTVGEVNARQQEIAETTADWVTNFTSEMDKIEDDMQTAVKKMNLSDEAKVSASSTITAYIDQIKAAKGDAVTAATDVANAVAAALANSNAGIDISASGSVPGHARGTTNAEDVFIAGENGPELIIGQQGSTVFPTGETERIINAIRGIDGATSINTYNQTITENAGLPSLSINEESGGKTHEQVKRISLEIAGSGALEISGGRGVSKETVLELLMEHIKPALMNVIQGEIYEEGDLAYDF